MIAGSHKEPSKLGVYDAQTIGITSYYVYIIYFFHIFCIFNQ